MKDKVVKIINIDQLVEEALKGHDNRTTKILINRYGLNSTDRKTLAALGDEYKLTRERVRQIEASALNVIRERIKEHKESIKLLKLFKNYLEDVGHVRRGDLLASDFSVLLGYKSDSKSLYNRLNFIADILQSPNISNSNEDWHVAWYSDEKVYKDAKKVADKMLKTDKHDFDNFLKYACKTFGVTEAELVNYLTISKRFGIGPYGSIGADSWVHVNPKTVRDKAYLVLEKEGQPLHFTEIAKLVNELSDKDRASATIHNELIKDPRFVLVSRGMYGINV